MRHIEVSIGFIEQSGAYLLQRRSSDQSLGAAGLIGAFGGTVEVGETSLEAVCREVSEETSLKPSAEDFKHLGPVTVISDRDHVQVQVNAEAYLWTIPDETEVVAYDGELVCITRVEADTNPDLLTPATKEVFRIYL